MNEDAGATLIVIPKDQHALDERYLTLVALDNILANTPLTRQEINVVSKFWETTFPYFYASSGHTTTQARKES